MKHDKFPRTLNEAFGPYAGDKISNPDEESYRTAKHMIFGIVVVMLLLLAAYLYIK